MDRKFKVGDIVFHTRHRYRGVIFASDSIFKGDEDWYGSSRLQPDRNQPWYHVLVDSARHTTYVAQENIERDISGEPVEHPLVEKIFAAYHGGRYYNHSFN